MTHNVAVLDFGSGKITTLIGQRGVNHTLNIVGSGESEYAGFSEGMFLNPGQLGYAIAHAINTAESNAKIKIDKLYVGVPGDFTATVCRDVSFSLGRKRKVTVQDVEALHERGNNFQEADNFALINCQPVYYMLDDERRLIDPVGLYSNKLSGHISYILAENGFVDVVREILKSIGIVNLEFVSSVLAETLFLFDESKRDQYVVLIDVGYITTNVVVARGDGILSQHSFSLGGGYITGDLATYFQTGFRQAEALKRKVELNLDMDESESYTVVGKENSFSYPAALVNKLVGARIATIGKAVAKCLERCEYEYPDYIPYYLTGGGLSYIRGAKDILSRQLSRQVEIVAPRLPQLNRPHLSSSLGMLDMALNSEEANNNPGFFARIFGKK